MLVPQKITLSATGGARLVRTVISVVVVDDPIPYHNRNSIAVSSELTSSTSYVFLFCSRRNWPLPQSLIFLVGKKKTNPIFVLNKHSGAQRSFCRGIKTNKPRERTKNTFFHCRSLMEFNLLGFFSTKMGEGKLF